MPPMEIKIVRQATRRTHGLAIPRAHRLRRADRRDGLQQRSNQQGQTDPTLQRLAAHARGISMAVVSCATKKFVSTGHRCR